MNLAGLRRALLVALVLLAGCQGDVVYVPVPPTPTAPTEPPLQPGCQACGAGKGVPCHYPGQQSPPCDPCVPMEPKPPPPPPPGEAAAAVEARIVVGATAAEVVAAVGRAPDSDVPASQAGPQTLRWIVTEGADVRMVYAVLRDGKVASKGISKVEVVR